MSASARAEIDQLFSSVYEQLRQVAHRLMGSRIGLTMQPTELVHELYKKLAAQTGANWRGREHFLRTAAKLMRWLFIDLIVRNSTRDKRKPMPPDSETPRFDEDMLDLHYALEELEAYDAPAAEVVTMKFFGGMTNHEVAEALGISRATVDRKWSFARFALFQYVNGNNVLKLLDGHHRPDRA